METKQLAFVFGTRPEAIKLAPLIRSIKEKNNDFNALVIATAQHREMLDQVLSQFQITPDLDLNIMHPNQTLNDLTCLALKQIGRSLNDLRPDLVIVQGDTTSVFAASLASFYLKLPVVHIEAGLRSNDIFNPYPEEINRQLTCALTTIHCAPTPLARENLLKEGVQASQIVVTGNTVVDSLNYLLNSRFPSLDSPIPDIPLHDHRVIVVTSHRRESLGQALENICWALRDLVAAFPDILVVYPVHLNPKVRETVYPILKGVERICLTDPLDYLPFINLLRHAYIILTDSGGIQEESPSLRKPLLVLRNLTERPEASQTGLANIIGTERQDIVREVSLLLTDQARYQAMTQGENPYGDGRATERIIEVLQRWFQGLLPLLEPAREFIPPGIAYPT